MVQRRFEGSVNEESLRAPIYDSVEEVEDPSLGDVVYITGSDSLPEGRWRYTQSGWRSGGSNNRITLNVNDIAIEQGSTVTFNRFSFPEAVEGTDETVALLWQAQLSSLQGGPSGLKMEIENVSTDNIIYELDQAGDFGVIRDEPGEPLAEDTAVNNEEYRARIQNTGQSTKRVSGLITFSIEYRVTFDE